MIKDVENGSRSFPAVLLSDRTWPDSVPTAAPEWCSLDLSLGNCVSGMQMSVSDKTRYFTMLCDIGLRRIEVASTETDLALLRALAECGLIPDGVTVQAAVPADEEVIKRTFEALRGVRKAALRLCGDIKSSVTAVSAASLIRTLAGSIDGTDVSFGFTVEGFSPDNADSAAVLCEEVMRAFGASEDKKIAVTLPCAADDVQPNRFADAVEYFLRKLPDRGAAVVGVMPRNFRCTAIAAAELALLAGAERIDGTLLSTGERGGFADISVLASGLEALGIPGGLNTDAIPAAREFFVKAAGVRLPPQGSSFTGDAAFILETQFGYSLPRAMQTEFNELVRKESEGGISPDGIFDLFEKTYVTVASPYRLASYSFDDRPAGDGHSEVGFSGKLYYNDIEYDISGSGNGPIDAFFNAISDLTISRYHFVSYSEHAVSTGSDSRAAAYIQLETPDGRTVFGVGISHNIYLASIRGIICAINRGVALRSVHPAPRRTF